ncbi:transcription factor domain-containing protein [Aspergillus stella-maris]|uniref:transcription factor domain-containing protein n=1 Tax=Aspergillus stella-maris TaxID=1810926 RepID=UPI003CCDD0E0
MVSSKKSDGRIWKACLSCRRKKIKCDGEDPCHNCQSREQICEFQDSNDNASASRRYAASFEERCQHMDNLCERLEGLAKTLSDCIASAQQDTRHETSVHPPPSSGPIIEMPEIASIPDRSPGFGLGAVSESSGNPQGQDTQTYPTPVDAVGHMVADSYGRLRYIGGATNKMMIEAVASLSPGGTSSKPLPCTTHPLGTSAAAAGPGAGAEVSLPFFIQGQVWPELPYLPHPGDLGRPPQYVSDLLVNIYFDQLHYTFPILYKPDFMRRYHLMNSASAKRDTGVGRGFISVFFAVCACASSLLPRAPGSSSLPGIEYYQKALLLHFASSGEVFLEQVQCLGLLALCSAGWNTLSQSWRFAGQAVRLAQDLGLHVSSLKGLSLGTPNPAEYIEAQVARCTWWSVFTLDCLMSTCLGRPMATDEADCCCDLPFDISNEDLETYGPPNPSPSHLPRSSPMTGFLAFTRLCRIAARVHRFYSSNRIRGRDGLVTGNEDWSTLLPTLDGFVRELDDWLQELPDGIRFSANMSQSGPGLTMCVIVFILHAGTVMNLYRPLAAHYSLSIPHHTGITNVSPTLLTPSTECITAAQSCIRAAELIRERVPPSHHLAFCVQYLTISGILLLSMTETETETDGDDGTAHLSDVKNALRFLGDLEAIWPGASRSRAILERLLQSPRVRPRAQGWGMGFPSLPVLDGLLWEQFPDSSEVFWGLNSFN